MAADGRQPLTGANIKYLLALDELCRDKDRVRSVHIAEKLGITKPSVHTMLKTLREMGLIHKDAAGIHLTREGEALARRYGRYQALLYAHFRALIPNDGDAGAAVTVLMAELPPDSLDVMCERLEWRRDNQLRMPAGSAEPCRRLWKEENGMAALLENPNFWYTICGVAIVLLAIFVIKGYVKRLSQGCCGSGSGEKVGKVKVGDKDKSHYSYAVVLTIDGMVCGNCARRVENALNALDGVWATVDVGAKQALVRMKQPVEEQVLRDTVNRIGAYTVMAVTPASS